MKRLVIGILVFVLFAVSVSAEYIYQEDADEYLVEGIWENPEYLYDGYWNTFGRSNDESTYTTGSQLWLSYNIPFNALPTSKLQAKVDERNILNLTIPSECWTSTTIQFRINHHINNHILVSCLDKDSKNVILYDSFGSIGFYEEAMWWDIREQKNKIIFQYGNKEVILEENNYVDIGIEDNEVKVKFQYFSLRQLVWDLIKLLHWK